MSNQIDRTQPAVAIVENQFKIYKHNGVYEIWDSAEEVWLKHTRSISSAILRAYARFQQYTFITLGENHAKD